MNAPDIPPGAVQTLRRYSWLFRVRPMVLAESLMWLLAPEERRVRVVTRAGFAMYIDPLSHLGRSLVRSGEYEPDFATALTRELRPGQTFVDVGANEGYFSMLGARLVGAKGRVIAVEPQRRLGPLIRSNALLNGAQNVSIATAAIAASDGDRRLFLAPTLNHGATSLVRRSLFWRRTETVAAVSATTLFAQHRISRADVVKVDVEGFEDEVARSLAPLCRENRVGVVLLDYHWPILAQRGVSAQEIHQTLIDAGMRCDAPDFRGYSVYRSKSA